MRRRLRGYRMLFPFLVVALLSVPLPAWSDQGDGAEQGKTEAEEKAEMAAAAKLTIHDAIEAATQEVRGKVIEAELEEKPRATWEVEVLTEDGKVMEVWIDVVTGAVVAVEEETADQEAEQETAPSAAQRPMGGMTQPCCGAGMQHGAGAQGRAPAAD